MGAVPLLRFAFALRSILSHIAVYQAASQLHSALMPESQPSTDDAAASALPDLPPDFLSRVLSALHIPDIATSSCVCTAWRGLAEGLWQERYTWQWHAVPRAPASDGQSWRDLCAARWTVSMLRQSVTQMRAQCCKARPRQGRSVSLPVCGPVGRQARS